MAADDELLDEDDLLERLGADPSPYADLLLVLRAAQQENAPWPVAWDRALRTLPRPRGLSAAAKAIIDEDRTLLRELAAPLRAAYERRERTDAELEREDDLVSRRAPELGRVA